MKSGSACVALVAMLFAACPGMATPATTSQPLAGALRSDLRNYLANRGTIEHISAASLSISLSPQTPNIDVAAGTTEYGGSVPVTPASLFQIGSNTKSFTATCVLQLEAEGALDINQRVGVWLPEYPAWKNITIKHLLDMTSGIPTYDGDQKMQAALAARPYRFFSPQELIAYIYPKTEFAPGKGWLYSNTDYLMAQMIVEKASHREYAVNLAQRFFNGGPRLADTYYSSDIYPAPIQKRMVAGYFYSNTADNAGLAPIYGHDVRGYSVSWMQGAGAIVQTPHALTRWVRALYESPMLAAAQRKELLSVVSMKNGTRIASSSAKDPRAFGLGVGEMLMPPLGRLWFYEGETLGYRMLYAYFPTSKIVIAIGLNSQPNSQDDKIGALMQTVAATLKAYGKM
jgi:D-alanyl-D-alanine carboxypeptidase